MGISTIDSIRAFYGDQPCVSAWFVVEQALIDKFAEATCDEDWLHTDPQRAREEGPFGGTIAFGFWTVSMLTHFSRQALAADYPAGALYGLNYGFDRVRLLTPVPIGARIRNHLRLVDVADRGGGRYLLKTENHVEVEGVGKPAMVADWLIMLVYAS